MNAYKDLSCTLQRGNMLQNGEYPHDVGRTGIDALTYDCLTTKGRQRKGQSKQREALPENAQQGTPTTGQERPHNARIPPCSGRALWRGSWRNHFLAGAAWLREDRAWKHPASATAHTRHGHEHRHKAKHSKIERPRETQAQARCGRHRHRDTGAGEHGSIQRRPPLTQGTDASTGTKQNTAK